MFNSIQSSINRLHHRTENHSHINALSIYTNGQMEEPPLLVSMQVTIKNRGINTLAGRAISAIRSLSRPLPLTLENYCPTVLFAL